MSPNSDHGTPDLGLAYDSVKRWVMRASDMGVQQPALHPLLEGRCGQH